MSHELRRASTICSRGGMACAAATVLAASGCLPASWGAALIVGPSRNVDGLKTDLPHRDVAFIADDGVELRGWLFPPESDPAQPTRGTIVYLHGRGSNRRGGTFFAEHFGPLGYQVLAYDSRAHGESGGETCTYGVREVGDLSRAIDLLGQQKVIVMGISMGAAVALQAAPRDPRICGVVADASFTDLRTAIAERSGIFTQGTVKASIAKAEQEGHFDIDQASPLKAARDIHVPVLLLHGSDDDETLPQESKAIYDAIPDPRKHLVIISGAGHDDVFAHPEAWEAIKDWLQGPDLATCSAPPH